jgi:hypothetical protein
MFFLATTHRSMNVIPLFKDGSEINNFLLVDKVTREFGCFTDNLLTRETTRCTNLTLTTGNGLKICFLSVNLLADLRY